MKIHDIENPEFLKDLNNAQLSKISKDIRKFLIENVSKTGGHLSSNLGVVELTIALHKVFNAPHDKIFFDVGHQCYTHKILTGRASEFVNLRTYNGLSGYQKRCESVYDCFEAGHSSTTISAAIGMAIARDLDNEEFHILPVIGDGALTGGMALEALNHLGHLQKKVIVILNDNEMSISKNVGGINNFLDKLRTSMKYNKAKQNYKDLLKKTKAGTIAYKSTKKVKDLIKNTVITNVFTDLGLDYIGPLDGHDFKDLERGLIKAKNATRPIVVHVMTKKGKGYDFAESDESGKWHGVGKFEPRTGEVFVTSNEDRISWSKAMADAVYNEMQINKSIVTITPAMISGSKLERIFNDFPDRSFDVGIAEQHATMLAAGLALSDKKPFLSIYSTFSQRSYDQFNHDLSRMNLGVVIGLDRSGLVGEDGETHHGVFDIALFRNLPNFIISAPKDLSELNGLTKLAFSMNNPFIIRYPRGETRKTNVVEDIKLGTWKVIKPIRKKTIISYGIHSEELANLLKDNNDIGLVHALFIKPLDTELLNDILKNSKEIYIYEPDIKAGGFGSSILEYINDNEFKNVKIKSTAIGDYFVKAGKIDELLSINNLDYESFIKNI